MCIYKTASNIPPRYTKLRTDKIVVLPSVIESKMQNKFESFLSSIFSQFENTIFCSKCQICGRNLFEIPNQK